VDSRIPPQGIDLDFTRWLGINQIPFMILFTKTDKLKANQIKKNIQTFKNQFLKDWEEMPMNLLTSSVTKEGRDTILDYIEETNQLFKSY
jgi:GTP-binding protein